MRTLMKGQSVAIQDIIDPSYSECIAKVFKPLRFGNQPHEIDPSHKTESFERPSEEPETKEENESSAAVTPEERRTTQRSKRAWICKFCTRMLPPMTLVGLFLLEYGCDTIARCKNEPVNLQNARTNIGVLVSAFSCGLIRQNGDSQQSKNSEAGYFVSYTDSFLLGNQIVCGCSDWKNENCVYSYNGTRVGPPQNAEWRSSVRLSRPKTLLMLEDVRRRVAAPSNLRWIPLRNNDLRLFVQQNGGFLACFSGRGIMANNTRVDACAYKTLRSSNFADVIIIARTTEHISLIFYSLPIANQQKIEPKLRGIVDGPSHIFRGIPVIYRAKSQHLASVEPMRIVVASLELLVHFDIRYTASSASEGFVLSHAIVLMLSVYTRLRPPGKGMWKKCSGNVMTIAPAGTIAVIVVLLFTLLSFIIAIVSSPEKMYALLITGRALESSRWAVNSMISEKFKRKTCMTGDNIDVDVVLRKDAHDQLHVSVVPLGGHGVQCEPEDIPKIQGETQIQKRRHKVKCD